MRQRGMRKLERELMCSSGQGFSMLLQVSCRVLIVQYRVLPRSTRKTNQFLRILGACLPNFVLSKSVLSKWQSGRAG